MHVAGLLYDVTGDYDPPFILATVAGAVATGLVLAATFIDRKQRKRRGQDDTEGVEVKTTVTNHELHEHCEHGDKETQEREAEMIDQSKVEDKTEETLSNKAAT